MSNASKLDAGKLLGFSAKGEPLFDIVMPAPHGAAETRAVGGAKNDGLLVVRGLGTAVGTGKAFGGGKAEGVTKKSVIGNSA